MLVAFVFLIACAWFGWTIGCRLPIFDDWHKRAAFTAGFGLLIGTWMVFLLSWLAGRLTEPTTITASLLLAAAAKYISKKYPHAAPAVKIDRTGIFVVAAVCAILMLINNSVVMGSNQWGDMTVGANVWYDYPLHFAVINSFAQRSNFPPQHPYLYGAPMGYHFIMDFQSAILVKGGLSLRDSILLPHLLSYFVLCSFAYFIGRQITKSKAAAAFAIILFLFNGNAGIFQFGQDAMNSKDVLNFVQHMPKPYSDIDSQGIKFMNNVFTIFIPQRATLLGFALSVIFYFMLLQMLEKRDKRTMALAGILLGLMPLTQAHSFLAASFVAACWAACIVAKSKKRLAEIKLLLWFAVPVLVLALPQAAWMFQQVQSAPKFFAVQTGWLERNANLGVPELAIFWLANAWLVLPLALIGIGLAKKGKRKIYLPFLALFIICNLFRFQEYAWDNMKIFIHWFFFSCVFAAIPLGMLWEDGRKTLKAAAIALLLASTASGLLTLAWWDSNDIGLYTREELQAADWIRLNTEPEAVWMTSDAQNNIVSTLAGRRIVAGEQVLAKSHGLDVRQGLRDEDAFYSTADCAIIRKYNVAYVLVGPKEDELKKANRALFRDNPQYEKVVELPINGAVAEIYRAHC
ncbi:MAG: hypothetical protein V1708_02825 [Candidatus Micrarchaeota archaeon]